MADNDFLKPERTSADGSPMGQLLSDTNPVQRREVSWEPSIRRLTVGKESAFISGDTVDNEAVLRTYLDLVAMQRHISLNQSVILRRDDIAVLAELLDLEDDHLEADLVAMLHLTPAAASRLHRRLLGRRLAIGALGLSLLAGVPLSQVVVGSAAASGVSESVVDTGTVGESSQIDIGEASVLYAPVAEAPAATAHVFDDAAVTSDPAAPVVVDAPAPVEASPDPTVAAAGEDEPGEWEDGQVIVPGPPVEVPVAEEQPNPETPTDIGEPETVERADWDAEQAAATDG